MRGGSPARKCRSEPFFSRICFRYSSMTGTKLSSAAARSLRGLGSLELGHHRRVGGVALERSPVAGIRHRVVGIDFLARQRIEQCLVEQLHAEILAGLDLVR